MRRITAALAIATLTFGLMVGASWACSPNVSETISVDPIDDAQASELPGVVRAKGEAFEVEESGCDDCGDLSHAVFTITAADTSSPVGVELDFPDGRPAGVGVEGDPTIFRADTRGPTYVLRVSWRHAKAVKVRARLVDGMGGAGAWSAVFTVRREEVSCSGGLGWPFFLLALAWRPLRRRQRG